jgi:hypothetical protein
LAPNRFLHTVQLCDPFDRLLGEGETLRGKHINNSVAKNKATKIKAAICAVRRALYQPCACNPPPAAWPMVASS